ncbi:HNH endonuclease signature motif containing protein [Acinetobacter sp. ANC 7454]|uniref:HNH endonuclease signature motif containing protein n=1 Tax=Acinetobacter thermotolerans TaxID=3151487 RepID=UPI00325A5DA9
MPKGTRINYTPEMEAFLHEHRYMLREEMTALFNQAFGTNISRRVLNSKCERIGALTGRTGRIEKGNKPWNTGTKGLLKANKTTFKKGNKPHNTKPVGYERITKDGYIEVKVAEPNKFMMKHRYVWEQVNGPVPKGHAIVFKNTDKQDCRIDNLVLVTRGELARLNQSYKHLVTPETNEACVAMAKIKHRVHQFEKGNI